MPPVETRLELARRTLLALGTDASELPPKLGVHPRQTGAHTGAMPALLRDADESGAADLVGMKWVTAFPGNGARGLPGVHATVILSDPMTGAPIAILDGAPLTAQRTAAVSGVALQEWWPAGSGTTAVTIVGAGVQGAAHVEVLAQVAPGCRLTIADRHAERATALAEVARDRSGTGGGFAEVVTSDDINGAIAGADVVLTMVSFGVERQAVAADNFERAALVVCVDYDMLVPAQVVTSARLFLVDDIPQFDATRSDTIFVGYPQPDASIGEALRGQAPALRGSGPVVVNHLGVGLADIVFADAILRRALELGLGLELPR
jgi:ornithine cyclodeaminase/alanine dehydrogenase-like protein (mu-crystallin family)